jgi:hypothetical protein
MQASGNQAADSAVPGAPAAQLAQDMAAAATAAMRQKGDLMKASVSKAHEAAALDIDAQVAAFEQQVQQVGGRGWEGWGGHVGGI